MTQGRLRAMNELTRMQYLDAMGIDMFVSRMRLPHSKKPTLCLLPETVPKVVSSVPSVELTGRRIDEAHAHRKHEASSPLPSSSIVSNVLAVLRNEPSSAEADSTIDDSTMDDSCETQAGKLASRVTETPTNNASLLSHNVSGEDEDRWASARFVLGLWRVGTYLQIVDSRSDGDALPTDLLLSNILTAHQLTSEPLAPQEILHWPLVNNSDDSWAAAHEMMTSFLEGRLLSHPASLFILFGADAFHAVMGAAADYEQARYQMVPVEVFSVDALVLPSLSELLHQPENKKLLWPLFQLLHTRINTLTDD